MQAKGRAQRLFNTVLWMIGDFNSASLAFGNSFYNSVIPCSVISILLFPALLRILFEQCVSSLRTLRCSQTALFPNSFFSCFITAMSSQISLRILIRGFFKRCFVCIIFGVCSEYSHSETSLPWPVLSAWQSLRAQGGHLAG